MISKELIEAIEAVDTINDELIDKMGDKVEFMIQVLIGSYSIGFRLTKCFCPMYEFYDDEEDSRIYNEETNTYESYYDYIIRKIWEFKRKINIEL